MSATTLAQAGSTIANPVNGPLDTIIFRTYRLLNDTVSYAQTTTPAADWGYASLTASGNTTVKATAGQLHSLVVGTATSTIAIYDGASANGNTILATSSVPAAGVYIYDVSFATGLFVVLGGSAVASVAFR